LVAECGVIPIFTWTAAVAELKSREDMGDHEVRTPICHQVQGVSERYHTSRVVLWPEARKIDTEYLDGPFK